MHAIVRSDSESGVLLTVRGDLDVGSAPDLYQAVSLAASDGFDRVTLDLGDVELIDWAGIGAVAAALWRMRSAGGDLFLASVSNEVASAIEVSRIAEIVEKIGEQH